MGQQSRGKGYDDEQDARNGRRKLLLRSIDSYHNDDEEARNAFGISSIFRPTAKWPAEKKSTRLNFDPFHHSSK